MKKAIVIIAIAALAAIFIPTMGSAQETYRFERMWPTLQQSWNFMIPNGTAFDHIGIVDDAQDADGDFRAINIWTVGRRTSSMALIGKSYPTVAAWFRLGNPLAYR